MMRETGVGVSRQAAQVMQAVRDIAERRSAHHAPLDAAVHLLVTAARLDHVALPQRGTPCSAEMIVTRVLRGWDAATLTAAEYLEMMPVAELDGFVAAGPAWAAAQRPAGVANGELLRAAA